VKIKYNNSLKYRTWHFRPGHARMFSAMDKTRIVIAYLAVMLTVALGSPVSAQDENPWEIRIHEDVEHTVLAINDVPVPCLKSAQVIWDESYSDLPYNAFPDLIRFRGNWYCVFREGAEHGNHESGRVRVIRSTDGDSWESVALFEWDGGDVRDAKFSVTAQGYLMVNSSVYFIAQVDSIYRQSVTWLSPDGKNWSSVYACESGINTWRWSVTWHNGMGYSIGYRHRGRSITLYRTRDGKEWETISENIFPGWGSEAALLFDRDDKAWCLLRYRPGKAAQMGVSEPPYSDWEWKDLGIGINGQEFIRLSDGRFLAAGRAGARLSGGPSRTSLNWIDPEKGILKEFLVLPSGNGTGYTGVVEHEGMLWVCYYSGHHDHGVTKAIYLARVKTASVK
jgi:hypothetical protein